MQELYNVIFKRRSVRKYNTKEGINEKEINDIKAFMDNTIKLCSDISTDYEIVKREQTGAKFGEYALVLYSDNKPNYLLNAGYILEQADLFMAYKGIGACWYGLAKPKQTKKNGLDFVIMIMFGKSAQPLRTGDEQFERKPLSETSHGIFDAGVKSALRLCPSACNSQPWRVNYSSKEIILYRETKLNTIIPLRKRDFFNSIDMGICMYILELSLNTKNFAFTREIINERQKDSTMILIAKYKLDN